MLPKKDLTLDACNVEEHVALGQVGRCGEGGQAELVLDVDGCPALDSHVKHLFNLGNETLQTLCHPHVVVDGQDVGDSAAVDVLEVVIPPLGKD